MPNFVSITGTFYIASNGNVGQAAGGVTFTASDLVWDTTTGSQFVGAVLPVSATVSDAGTLPTGTNAPQLLAMDNAGYSGNWAWICVVEVSGVVWPARKITVNYANGATQDLSTLLQASTLV